MRDESEMLKQLRAIRAEQAEHSTVLLGIKERLGLLEAGYASLSRRVDRMDERLERIERRLELTGAPS
jgi:chromosome segregation ATPase